MANIQLVSWKPEKKRKKKIKRVTNFVVIEETHPHPDIRTFHTNTEISQNHINSFKRPLRESSKPYLAEVGPDGSAIVNDLLTVDGIIEVTISSYEIAVHIGKAFSWEDMNPQIQAILRKHCEEPMAEVATPTAEDQHDKLIRGLQKINAFWERPLFADFGKKQR